MFHSNLPFRRVFILGDNSLFEEGMTHMLRLGTGLHVSNVKYINDLTFLEMVVQNKPDVIVLDEAKSIDAAHILELLFSTPALVSLCIIIVRLGNNMIDVYKIPKNQRIVGNIHERRQFTITKRDDFLAVVQGTFQRI